MIKRIFMMGVIGFMTMGLPSFCCGGPSASAETSQKVEAQKEYLRLKTEDAMELLPFIGKDIKTLAIPEEAIKYIGAHPFTVYYDGQFLNYPCTSILMHFSYDYETKVDRVESITISCKQPGFMQCKAYLDEQLGECYYSDTTPYAAVNGGAVTSFIYYKDGYKYHLSNASARNYYTLVLKKEEPKGAPYHGNIGIVMLDSISMPFKVPAPVSKPAVAVDTREVWACEACGYPTNKGKFCGECGTPRKK